MASVAVLASLGLAVMGSAANAAPHPSKAINIFDDASQSPAKRTALLESMARSEGKMFIYSGTTGTALPGLISGFEQTYPYIKVSDLEAPPATLIGDITAADSSGADNWDAVDSTTEYELIFRQIGAIQPYYTPEETDVPYVDNVWGPNKEVWGLGFYQLYAGVAYSKALVPNPPTSIEGLLNPAWDGEMALTENPSGEQWIGAVLADLGTKKGEAFLQQLKPEVKLSGSTTTALMSLAGNGQQGFVLGSSYATAHQVMGAGGNLGWLPILRIVNLEVEMMAVHPPDPAAALLWADYVESPAGQAVARSYYLPTTTEKFPKVPADEGAIFYPGKLPGITAYKYNQAILNWTNIENSDF